MKFLDEKDRNNSSMRLAFLIIIITSCLTALGALFGFIIAITLNRDLSLLAAALGGIAGIIGSLLVPAFGGKGLQKFAESNNEDEIQE